MSDSKIDQLLKLAAEKGASDLHLVVGKAPILRINGILKEIPGEKILTKEIAEDLILSILNDEQREKFFKTKELDISYDIEKTRFRVNCHFGEATMALAARVIPSEVPAMKEIGLGETIYKITKLKKGFILVTGPTGCGKSTSLAAMINQINIERPCHIITIEDPIEFNYKHQKSIVLQRELGRDTLSFKSALKHVVRQDPNVILVGEMRDLETIAAAVTLAETGHLVFATLHTPNACQSIDRIVDVFPPYQQQQIRLQLANTLRAIIAQILLPLIKPNPFSTKPALQGRIAAREILINNPAISNLIRENQIAQIPSIIQTSRDEGMITMDQSIKELYRQGYIDENTARSRMQDPELLKYL